MSAEKKNQKKKKLIGWIIAVAAVAALGAASAIVIPKLFAPKTDPGVTDASVEPTEETDVKPTDEVPPGEYTGDIYWNVERLKYAGKSEAGLSSRTVNKDDGYYHVLLAVNGRQVERRAADKKIVNLIDTQDIMGLTFDENGLINGIVPIMSIIDEFSYSGMYVKSEPDGPKVELNCSSRLDCRCGECGYCRTQLVAGTIFVSPLGDGRREMDKQMGWFHACSAYPTGDLTVHIPIL